MGREPATRDRRADVARAAAHLDLWHRFVAAESGSSLLGVVVVSFAIISSALLFLHPLLGQALKMRLLLTSTVQGQLTVQSVVGWTFREAARREAELSSTTPDLTTTPPAVVSATGTVPVSLVSGPEVVLMDQSAATVTLGVGRSIPLVARIKDDFSFRDDQPTVQVAGNALLVTEPEGYRVVPWSDLTPHWIVEGVGDTPGSGTLNDQVFTATTAGNVQVRLSHFVTGDGRMISPGVYANSLTLAIGAASIMPNALTVFPFDAATLQDLTVGESIRFRGIYVGSTEADVTNQATWTFTLQAGQADLTVGSEGALLTPLASGSGTLRLAYTADGLDHTAELSVRFTDPSRGVRFSYTAQHTAAEVLAILRSRRYTTAELTFR